MLACARAVTGEGIKEAFDYLASTAPNSSYYTDFHIDGSRRKGSSVYTLDRHGILDDDDEPASSSWLSKNCACG